MKTLKYIAVSILSLSIIGACNKKLDVTPQQNITPDEIKTSDDVEALLFGEYSLWQNSDAFGEGFILSADLLASKDQVRFVGTFTDYKDLENKTQNAENGIPLAIWSNGYKIINLSNTVLDKIGLVNADDQSIITGEAELFRGETLFELVNFFSQPYSTGNISAANSGVPVVLDPPKYVYDSTSAFVSRASIEDVYKQVISDLTDAVAKLPSSADNARATKYTAEAFLSRVYLNMADYTNAATMANDVINSGNFNLVSTFNQAFNNVGNSPEDIFGIQQTAQSNAGISNSGLTTFYSAQPTGRGDAQVAAGYKTYFEASDFRKTFSYPGVSIGGFSGTFTSKWKDLYKTIPVIRLPEMYLTRGEANLRNDGSPVGGVSPLTDINIVRKRANASQLITVTASNFVDERMRELGFEGDRVWTLKRLQMQIDGLPYNNNKLILPIPQREIDVNKNLVQNPGY